MITISWVSETTRQQPEGGDRVDQSSGELKLDIVESENYESAITITEHAVQDGAPTTDHIIQKNDRETITVNISDRPIKKELFTGVESGSIKLESGQIASGLIPPSNVDRKSDVHEELIRLMKTGTRVDVDGLVRPLEEWLIESISAPRTIETAGLLVCDISFMEFRTSVLEEVEAPSPRVERGRNRRDNGRSQTSNADDTTAGNDTESLASQLTNRLLG